ncbi:hypothetical protein K439DRAFT_1641449 [Ramaria rubella]|nr:hypothetical protein K439DRAFT_1641449 [Ramaria rubella]
MFTFLTVPLVIGRAELTLGGTDDTKFQGPLISQPTSDGNWVLPSAGIMVNERVICALLEHY